MKIGWNRWKRRLKTAAGLLLPVFGLPLSVLAASGSANYTFTQAVVDAGGGLHQSASYTIHDSFGQSVAGVTASASYTLQSGFLPVPDTDADGWRDHLDNCPLDSNAGQLDTDGDGLGNACDSDDDNDGLSDAQEAVLGTDPLVSDTDADGLGDFDEVNMDGDPSTYQVGVDTDPNNADTDGDGLPDGSDPDPLVPAVFADGDLAPLGAPDGVVDAADVLIAQRIVQGLITPSTLELSHGDVYPPGSPDGVIDVSDLLLIQQMALGQP